MVTIASISVAVGMAVMIISMSVIGGFRRQITDRLVGFGADVQIIDIRSDGSAQTLPVVVSDTLESVVGKVEGFRSIAPFAVKSGIIKTSEAIEGVTLKGVDASADLSMYARSLIEGSLPDRSDSVRHKELLISKITADNLLLGVGDKVEMIFVGDATPVRRDLFKVSGIYQTGMDDMDRYVTLTDIRNVQRLNRWAPNQVSGYEVRCDSFDRVEQFTTDVRRAVMLNMPSGMTLHTIGITELYPGIFDWLKTHDVNAAVIIVIMLVVALLNMISAMLIILLERTSMIGVLKALGMRNSGIRRIFLGRSLSIVARGMVWGNVVGLAVCAVQHFTHIIKLDSSGYMLSEVPISFGWDWFVGLNVGVPVVITLCLMVPITVVSLIKPEQTIRYR